MQFRRRMGGTQLYLRILAPQLTLPYGLSRLASCRCASSPTAVSIDCEWNRWNSGGSRAMLRVEIFLIRVLEITFFTGLAGCAVTVVLSWLSIFGGEFSKEEDPRPVGPIEHSQSSRNNLLHSELRRQ